MASIEIDPIRLETPGSYSRRPMPAKREMPLPPPVQHGGSFRAALLRRRSAAAFDPIPSSDLATWLYYTASVQSINSEDRNRQQRCVGSFGALHPAHILLGEPNGMWTVYVAERHTLGELTVDAAVADALRAKAQQHFLSEHATLVALLSDWDLAVNYYQNPLCLMLRDGGVLFGHAALVAAALGLSFRILGSTGTPFTERLVSNISFKPTAVGLAWIGRAHAD